MTLFLREASLSNEYIKFALGIMPNISATWLFIYVGEIIFIKKNMDFNFKIASITSGVILLFALGSEIVHDLFLNSPFDTYDIVATILSIIIYLTIFYFQKNDSKGYA